MAEALLDRVARVRILLGSMNDWLPTPQGALRSDSGPATSRYVPCETCRATGWLRMRSGHTLCLVCDGTGAKRREHGDIEWDSYTGLPVAQAAALPTMPNGRPTPEEIVDESYAWERAHASYERHGSYKEVRLRLDQLGQERPPRGRLVRLVLVDKEPVSLSPWHDVEITLGVTWIALRMRSVRVPAWLMERSRAAERRETVTALYSDGYSVGEIARRTGVSRKAIRRKIHGLVRYTHEQPGLPAGRA
jgi:DNA-binding CsgD family transcriptional regulator